LLVYLKEYINDARSQESKKIALSVLASATGLYIPYDSNMRMLVRNCFVMHIMIFWIIPKH